MSSCQLVSWRDGGDLPRNERGFSSSPLGFREGAIYEHCPPRAQRGLAGAQLPQMDGMAGRSPPSHRLDCHCVKCLVVRYGAVSKSQLYLSVFFFPSDLWMLSGLQRIPPGGSVSVRHPNQ